MGRFGPPSFQFTLLVVAAASGCSVEVDRGLLTQGRFLSAAAAGRHTCAADVGKNILCWGDNATGQLGVSVPAAMAPKLVAPGEWIDVATGGHERGHTCAIHFQGSLWCWGDNRRGQLGLGEMTKLETSAKTEAVDSSGWVSVAAGDAMTCAVRDNGGLYCWGANDEGQLGSPDGDARRPRNVGFETGWRAVTARGAYACALKDESGAALCWGSNSHGQLGRSDVTVGGRGMQPGPVSGGEAYQQLSAGRGHICGVRTDGSLWCWGDDSHGQLGAGDGRGSAAVVAPVRVAAERRWVQVAAGGAHTCAIARDGFVFCWGSNDEGQLGTGAAGADVLTPTRVLTDRVWRRVLAGEQHTCAETEEGRFACWGDGTYGQTGVGTGTQVAPVFLSFTQP